MHSNYLETTTCWHAPLPLRMWNRFGRVVTLEVCAGVAPTLIVTTVPCPHINQVLSLPIGPSIHVGRAKTSLNGISPNRGMAFLTHHGNAPRGGCLYSYLPILRILTTCIRCELCSQRYPNLLPVAGGGGATLTLWLLYRKCFLLCHQNPIPRAFGVLVSVGQLGGYLLRLVTFLQQLPLCQLLSTVAIFSYRG